MSVLATSLSLCLPIITATTLNPGFVNALADSLHGQGLQDICFLRSWNVDLEFVPILERVAFHAIDIRTIPEGLPFCDLTLIDLSTHDQPKITLDRFRNDTKPEMTILVLVLDDQVPGIRDYLLARLRFLNLLVVSTQGHVYKATLGLEFGLALQDFWNGERFVLGGRHFLNHGKHFDLGGRVILGSGVDYPPFFKQIKGPQGQVISQEGIELDLVKTIAHSIKAELNVGLPTDGKFWGRDKDGDEIFDGMVGDLQLGKTDIGFAQVFAKAERLSIMDFSLEYDYDYDAFLVLKPAPLPQIVAMTRPFTPFTWMMSGLALGVSCGYVLLYECLDRTNSFRGMNGIFFLISATLVESHKLSHEWKSFSGRLFMATFLIGIFILSKGYSGGLVSFLTVPLTTDPINSIQGVVNENLPTSTRGGSSFISYISTNPLIMKLRDSHQSHGDYDEAFRNFSRGQVILFQSRQLFDFEIRNRLTDMFGETKAHIVQEYPRFHRVALGLTKSSPLGPIVNDRVQKLKESGLIQKWTQHGMERVGKLNSAKSKPTNTILGLHELEGHFIIWGVSISSSVLAFACECICKRCKIQ